MLVKNNGSRNMCGFQNIAHGGITATLLDEIGAYALGLKYKMFGFTLSANVLFHRPVPVETEIYLKAIVIDRQENIVQTHAEILNANGEILAECSSEWKILTPEKIAKISGINSDEVQWMLQEIFATQESEPN